MEQKALAFISPIKPFENLFHIPANIDFVTGERKGKSGIYEVTTDIFKYYYFGTTLEVVELDKIGNIINIRDVQPTDLKEFNLNILKVYSFNLNTTDMMCSNGFVYILNQSKFWRDYPQVCNEIMKQMQLASNFVMYAYTMNNTILSVNVEFNLKETDKRYKRAIHRGFITEDKKLLKMMSPPISTDSSIDPNEKLSQKDVDKLLDEMLSK